MKRIMNRNDTNFNPLRQKSPLKRQDLEDSMAPTEHRGIVNLNTKASMADTGAPTSALKNRTSYVEHHCSPLRFTKAQTTIDDASTWSKLKLSTGGQRRGPATFMTEKKPERYTYKIGDSEYLILEEVGEE